MTDGKNGNRNITGIITRDVYAAAEAKLRELLLARPQARGRGKSPEFIDKAIAVGIWILRRHGPYGPRIFSACRAVLRKVFGRCCRAVIEVLLQVGLLKHLARAKTRALEPRKWRSPEYAAFQFEVGAAFAQLFPTPSAGELRREAASDLIRPIGEAQKQGLKAPLTLSGVFVPIRTWDRARPEFRLPSKVAIKRAATASLEALQALPLPGLSSLALATLARPTGSLR